MASVNEVTYIRYWPCPRSRQGVQGGVCGLCRGGGRISVDDARARILQRGAQHQGQLGPQTRLVSWRSSLRRSHDCLCSLIYVPPFLCAVFLCAVLCSCVLCSCVLCSCVLPFMVLTPGYKYCTWKRRFFRLERTSLAYYKSETATSPKGVIELTPYSLCKVPWCPPLTGRSARRATTALQTRSATSSSSMACPRSKRSAVTTGWPSTCPRRAARTTCTSPARANAMCGTRPCPQTLRSRAAVRW
jgi:hypothetical protein